MDRSTFLFLFTCWVLGSASLLPAQVDGSGSGSCVFDGKATQAGKLKVTVKWEENKKALEDTLTVDVANGDTDQKVAEKVKTALEGSTKVANAFDISQSSSFGYHYAKLSPKGKQCLYSVSVQNGTGDPPTDQTKGLTVSGGVDPTYGDVLLDVRGTPSSGNFSVAVNGFVATVLTGGLTISQIESSIVTQLRSFGLMTSINGDGRILVENVIVDALHSLGINGLSGLYGFAGGAVAESTDPLLAEYVEATQFCGPLLGVSWSGSAYAIDSAGNATLLGPTGFSSLNSLAMNNAGEAYSMSGSSLITIDPVNGGGTFVASTALTSCRGLAFDPNDTLWAIEDNCGPCIGADALYRIDPATGASTFVGNTGFFGVQGLTWAGTGALAGLYGWECGTGGGTGVGLIRISTASGAGSDVNPAVNGTCGEVQSLVWDGTSRFVLGAKDTLQKVDIATGVLSTIGGFLADIRGIEFSKGGGCAGPALAVTGATAGGIATVTVNCATANGAVVLGYSLAGGGPVNVNAGCAVVTVSMSPPFTQVNLTANVGGTAAFTTNVPTGTTGVNVWTQAFDVASCTITNGVQVTL